MFRNYLSIALRYIYKQRLFSLINIFGLAIGISAAMIIYLLIEHEHSFDRHHQDRSRIYRVVSTFNYAGESFYNSGVTMPLGEAAHREIAGIAATVPIFIFNTDVHVSAGSSKFRNQANVVSTCSDYFKVFSYKWIAGSPDLLDEGNTVVITDERARLYFPGIPAAQIIGKKLALYDSIPAIIKGVIHQQEANTDLNFEVFVSWPTFKAQPSLVGELNDWTNTSSESQLFLKLNQGQRAEQIADKLFQLHKKYNADDGSAGNKRSPYHLQPLSEIHFDAKYGVYFDNPTASHATLFGLSLIALIILLLGCINFINLNTAQASQRAREIGIRKTIGGSRKQLIGQFLTETFLLTLMASIVSLLFIPLLMRLASDFLPQRLIDRPFSSDRLIVFIPLLLLAVTLLAGCYPAWLLSAFKPVRMLKNNFVAGKQSSGLWLRKALTVSQFTIAQVFIIAVVVVVQQIDYSVTLDPGFRRDAIVHFQTDRSDTSGTRRELLLNKLTGIPDISLVSVSNNPVAATGTWSSTIIYKTERAQIETHVQMKMADTNYLKLYELRLLAGRNLRHADSIQELIINETYAKALGFTLPHQALNKVLYWDNRPVPIVGVVGDFHQQSLHAAIKPLAIGSWPLNHRTFNVGLSRNASFSNWQDVITKIQRAYHEVYPEQLFEFSFQNDTIRRYYDREIKIAYLMKCAAGITIFLSVAGLLGLSIYSTARRTREIGVRKVFGASVFLIVRTLTTDYFKLLLFGFVIALPLAWWAASVWLDQFAYRVSLSWWMFASAFCGQLLVAALTVGSQSLRAAMQNPVNALRTEAN